MSGINTWTKENSEIKLKVKEIYKFLTHQLDSSNDVDTSIFPIEAEEEYTLFINKITSDDNYSKEIVSIIIKF